MNNIFNNIHDNIITNIDTNSINNDININIYIDKGFHGEASSKEPINNLLTRRRRDCWET